MRTTVNDEGTVVHFDDYYPFGAQMPGTDRSLQNEPPKERYSGKELDTETGLSYYGARYYDPVIVRWNAVDPLAEKHPDWSPYNFVLANPLRLIDPDGRQVEVTKAPAGHSVVQWHRYQERLNAAKTGPEALAIERAYANAHREQYASRAIDFGLSLSTPYSIGTESTKLAMGDGGWLALTLAVLGGKGAKARKASALARSQGRKFASSFDQFLAKQTNVKVIGSLRLGDTPIAADWARHSVLIRKDWSEKINIEWREEGIANKHTFYLASPDAAMYNEAGKVTWFGREMEMVKQAGYVRVGDHMVHPDNVRAMIDDLLRDSQ